VVFPELPPQSRKELNEVIVSQLPEWRAEAVASFCAVVKNVSHAAIYDKIVTKAQAKYGDFSFWDIDAEAELEQECIDLLVYLAIIRMKKHYSSPSDGTIQEPSL
jgi:hypothetical protein